MRKSVWIVLIVASVAVIGGILLIRMIGSSLQDTFEEVSRTLEEVPKQGKDSKDKVAGPKPFEIVQVFFATDRQRTTSEKPGQVYGVGRSDLTYGICEVSIPRDHRLGKLESPSIWKLEFREDPEKHVVLLKVEAKNHDAYFEEISERVRSSTSKSAFLFVHGYNVTFEQAARRTAQMAYDLKFDGAPVFYSWPSHGSTSAYTVDENNVEWTELHLQEFLRILSGGRVRTGSISWLTVWAAVP